MKTRQGRAKRPRRTAAWKVLAVGLTVSLAGCTGSDGTSAGSAETSASASSSSTASATASSEAGADVVTLAEAFAATLDDEQLSALNQDYTFENAANWSNLPNALLAGGMGGGPGGGSNSTGRVGLQTSTLTDEQWTALEDLLAGATGTAENEGYDEIVQHLEADDYLGDNGGGDDYGRGNFFVAFLGTPSASGTWELQFGGHHLAVSNTYTDGALVGATPSFRGIEPMDEVEVDGDTVIPEQQERAAFAELLASLDDDQLTTATLSDSFNDILLGPGKDWAFPESSEGLVGSDLTDDQKALLLTAIETYVGDLADGDAQTILAQYEDELDETYVAYTGDIAMENNGDYVRIDGPSVWIEFSMQNGVILDGAHPHAVWRDKTADYGGLTS
ncbi:DUF3500 domain-containing protein [Promicromonospora sp. NFX87]|uniref:DUF3500 domain-containing protein n=1 Tax=Promicromonospora sp. NFX87 TaxID=3402691 RepID=UPI003AFB68EC